ncbi:MAG: tRNA (N6-threonylcarbamoyladenosine(37)-N6)-methyltransferase TrmO [Candidatus Aminicenantes bacterium]|nr:tRNA (N6-threonylcarbamoyladenosine(37)-N6)-methyltransferase TrmO [Candidatus Aminicenantes bacterium]
MIKFDQADFQFKPIGFVHSQYKKREDIPSRKNTDPAGYEDIAGRVEVLEEYADGLKDLEGFSHVILIFAFHLSQQVDKLHAHPPFDGKKRGVFATRSPNRPNPIGMTVARVLDIKKNFIYVSGIDMLDGTPVLDIKPYTDSDRKENIRLGWLEDFGQGKK